MSEPGYPPYATKAMLGRYIPEADPEHPRAKSLRVRLSRRSIMLRIQVYLTASVTTLNLASLIWVVTTHRLDPRSVATLYTGNCHNTRVLNSITHLLLNVLSSLFLGAGNYCMQIIAAPSRADLDWAHAFGDWLEIGVPSFENLCKLQHWRAIHWLALGSISTLLHLVWNSTVFASVPFTIFTGAIATSDVLLAPDSWEPSNTAAGVRIGNFTNKNLIYGLKDRAKTFTYLDKSSCLQQYIDPLKTTSDVIIVAKNLTSTQNNGSSLIQGWVNGLSSTEWAEANSWVCFAYQPLEARARFCSPGWALSFADDWELATWEAPRHQQVTVDYCLLGEQGNNQERCGFHFSAPVMGLVCFCTLVGCLLILWTTRIQKDKTMVTMGDAVATFLECPEDSANETHEFRDSFIKRDMFGGGSRRIAIKAAPWSAPSSTSRFCAVSRRIWFLLCIVFLAGLILPLYFLRKALVTLAGQGMGIGISSLWQQGLGKTNGFALIGGPWKGGLRFIDFSRQILLTNSFQILISCVYLCFNNIVSRQLVAAEWVRLLSVKEKKPLRVSSPQGLQRSSYMLSMPFAYAIPFIVYFVLMHWLVSQAIFIVQTTVYESGAANNRLPSKDGSRVGFSTIGIIFVVMVEVLLICFLLIHSAIRRYRNVPPDFPRMGTCSAAISAVCHPPQGDTEAYMFPVSMGVVEKGRLGHRRTRWLTFSTWVDLKEPEKGPHIIQPVIERKRYQ